MVSLVSSSFLRPSSLSQLMAVPFSPFIKAPSAINVAFMLLTVGAMKILPPVVPTLRAIIMADEPVIFHVI